MMQDRLRAQDIIMGLAAFIINPQSKDVGEGIMKMLLQNHSRALQIEDEKIEVKSESSQDNSAKVEIANTSFGEKMKELENSQSSYKNDFLQTESQADFSKVQPVGMFHLLTEKFSTAELKTLCFEFKVDYDDISGDTKRDKARELILHLKRRDRLNEFYDFLIAYLERRS